MKNEQSKINQPKSQTEVDQTVLDFLGNFKINEPDDLIPLIKHIKDSLEFREYNKQTAAHADSIQWKRTVSQILQDGYVYQGKACSDLSMILVALCKALGLEAQLVKLVNLPKDNSHSITEIKINGEWYRIDPDFSDPKPIKGYWEADQVLNKNWAGGWKVWKRGDDLWSMGLDGIDKEELICREEE